MSRIIVSMAVMIDTFIRTGISLPGPLFRRVAFAVLVFAIGAPKRTISRLGNPILTKSKQTD